MNGIVKKTGVALGLYHLSSLLAKFHELFIINRKRFFHYEIKTIPQQMVSSPIGDRDRPEPMPCKSSNQKKTIYFLVHCFYPFSQGGTERFIYNMAMEAKHNENEVKIITYNATRPRSYFKQKIARILFNEYQIDGLNVIEYRHIRAPRGILKDMVVDDPDIYPFAEFLFERDKPDLVHAGYLQRVSSLLDAFRKLSVPYGITLTSYFCLCHYDIMINQHGDLCSSCEKGSRCRMSCPCLDVKDSLQRYHKMEQILKDAAFVTAPSNFVKQLVEKEFPGQSVQVIHHGLSGVFMPPADCKQWERKDEIKNFAYIGNLIPIKGVHVLIAAFKELPPHYKLNIYGNGSEMYINRLKKLAAGRENIIFQGCIKFDGIKQVYQENEIIIVPSIWYETYNFVVHEALLMNRIVVASNIGAIPERILDGKNGLCFKAGNWQDLKIILDKVINHEINIETGSTLINTVENEYAGYDILYEKAIKLRG